MWFSHHPPVDTCSAFTCSLQWTILLWTWLSNIPQFFRVNTWNCWIVILSLGFPGGSVVRNLPATAGGTGLIPGSGRSSGGGHWNPPQYPCLENPMDRGVWWATVMGSQSRTRLSDWTTTTTLCLTFWGLDILFSTAAAHRTVSQRSPFSISLPIATFSFLGNSHPNRCEGDNPLQFQSAFP